MRRNETEMKLDVLLNLNEPTIKTRLMYNTNINHSVLTRHLNTLIARGCIRTAVNGKRIKYVITNKGLQVASSWEKIKEALKGI